MDATKCEEPYFQWDDKNNVCAGCIENGVLHENCKRCEDYTKNVERERYENKQNHRRYGSGILP